MLFPEDAKKVALISRVRVTVKPRTAYSYILRLRDVADALGIVHFHLSFAYKRLASPVSWIGRQFFYLSF